MSFRLQQFEVRLMMAQGVQPRSLQVLGTVSKGLLHLQGTLGSVAPVQQEEVSEETFSLYPLRVSVMGISVTQTY